ncbi:hypothetical protein KI387_026691, partial [Taxus chinensis]
NEKEKITQNELEAISIDILEKTRTMLDDWKTLEAEIKTKYPELILLVKEEDVEE